MRCAILVCLVLVSASLRADYIEIRSNARVYEGPNRSTTSLLYIVVVDLDDPLRLPILQDTLENGYYRVRIPDGRQGWVYKSRGRKFAGDIPGESSSGMDEEITPDTQPTTPGTLNSLERVTDPGLRIFMFDLGQADSTLVVGPPPERRTLLIDLGEQLSGAQENYLTVRQRIVAITGRPHVDFVVLTHFHEDHIGHPGRGPCSATGRLKPSGLFGLLDDDSQPFTVGTLFDRGDDQSFTPNRSTSHCGVLQAIDGWVSAGKVERRMVPSIGTADINLGPGVSVDVTAVAGHVFDGDMGAMAFAQASTPNLYSASQPASENDYSVALEISIGDFEFFTAGDLTGRSDDQPLETHQIRRFGDNATVYTNVEGYMVSRWQSVGRESDIEIYRANHHGSGHSSSPALASALDPEVVLYSTGGAYGHPADTTVNRFNGRDQLITTMVSADTWPTGLPQGLGTVVGEIEIAVAADGSRYQIIERVYPALTDAQESL